MPVNRCAVYEGMTRERLEALLAGMGRARIGLAGDVGLDVYWLADMRKSQLSRETPHYPLPIVSERMSPGAGGNVAANMAALRPAQVRLISAVGRDWRGLELERALARLGIDTSCILTDDRLTTNAYCKPLRSGHSDVVYEDPRIDFTNAAPPRGETEDALIEALDRSAPDLDVLCVSDQFACGVVTDRVREHIGRLAAQGLLVAVDSREHIGLYRGAILKPNELEGIRAAGAEPRGVNDASGYARVAKKLSARTGCEVVMTLGPLGAVYASGDYAQYVPARPVEGPIDICGAGDTFLSGFGLALAAGATRPEAAFVGALCSEVTIRQIGTTGTATREQVMERFAASASGR